MLHDTTVFEKCPNTEFFLVRIQENTVQKKISIWTLFTQYTSSNTHLSPYAFGEVLNGQMLTP